MTSLRGHGVFVVMFLFILLCTQLPLGTALEFSGDEGFELMKGFLCSKGFVLYKEIWSDQPPLYTLLLKWAFQTAGPSILVARLIAAGFGLLLFSVFFELVRRRSGQLAAAFATFFLVASPVVLLLSVAVMKEAAALGMALLSVLILRQPNVRGHWTSLVVSGVCMGMASEIKFSALLVSPALLLEILQPESHGNNPTKPHASQAHSSDSVRVADLHQPQNIRLHRVTSWLLSFVLVITIIGLAWSKGSFEPSWRAHLTSHNVLGFQIKETIKLPAHLLFGHLDVILLALAGIVFVFCRQRWRNVRFPLVLLITVVAVHCVHRPWWDYYYLHLAIPLAWLAGYASAEMTSNLFRLINNPDGRRMGFVFCKGIAICTLISLATARSSQRFKVEFRALSHQTTVEMSPVILKMKDYSTSSRWAYSDDVIYAFHAGLPVPPELAVITPKRFWSGQITTQQLIDACKHYQPELIILTSTTASYSEWREFLNSKYLAVASEKIYTLYVAKRP